MFLSTMEQHKRKYTRNDDTKRAEPDVCPNAGTKQFTIDTVRFCLITAQGGTCNSFRVQPFEDCQAIRIHRILDGATEK